MIQMNSFPTELLTTKMNLCPVDHFARLAAHFLIRSLDYRDVRDVCQLPDELPVVFHVFNNACEEG